MIPKQLVILGIGIFKIFNYKSREAEYTQTWNELLETIILL